MAGPGADRRAIAKQIIDRAATTAHRDVLNAGREVIRASSTRWRRVTDGSPCGFCAMIASRGPVYTSATTAGQGGNRYHSHCGCSVEPFEGDPKTWAPTQDEQRYIDAYNASWRSGDDAATIAKRMGEWLANPANARLTEPETALARLTAALDGRGKVVGFDAAGLDARAVDETLDTLTELLTRYPGVKIDVIMDEEAFTGTLRTATAFHRGGKDGAHQLYFRPSVHADYAAAAKADDFSVRTGWLVDAKGAPFRRVAAHEFGHAVEYEFAQLLAPRITTGHRTGVAFLQHAVDDGATLMSQAKGRLKRQSPSHYGSTNFAEVFAETFAELYLNGGVPSKRKFSRWMAERLADLEGRA